MRRTLAVVALSVLVCGLVIAGGVLAANGYLIRRSVIGGGGQSATGGGMVLNGTIGEPVASDLQVGSAYGLSSGFWHPGRARTVYVPLVQQEASP